MADPLDELQVLCAAHELGLGLRRLVLLGTDSPGASRLWAVFDEDAQNVVARSATREGAIAWLAERVFRPHEPGKIDWT